MSFPLICYTGYYSSNTPGDIESSLAQSRTGMAKSRRSIGGCRVHREDQQVLKLIMFDGALKEKKKLRINM